MGDNVAKVAEGLALIVVVTPIAIGIVFLFFWSIETVYYTFNEKRDYKTERLARDMSHDLRNLASVCAYSNEVPASAYCQDTYGNVQNICKGTVASQLEGFCLDWEVITYIKSNGAYMATHMIELAQDIEEWLE